MADIFETVAGKLKDLGGSWASYTALGSFALYVVGYLALRFHLTALGVGTDLTALDERYVFTGAKFLVYLCSAIPIVLMAATPVAAMAWLLVPLIPAGARKRIGHWMWRPARLASAGVIVSVLMIQLVMRQCFVFGNLLLADDLPQPVWLQRLLLSENEAARSLYFSALVAGIVITLCLLLAARGRAEQTPRSRFLTALLTPLVVIQFLLLPVNYGVMIIDKTLPKVADLGGIEQLKEGQEAWLVWEGKDGATYLVRETGHNGAARRLVTLPQKDVKKTQIIRYDPILRCVFVGRCAE